MYLSIIMPLLASLPCIFIDAGLSGCPECFPEPHCLQWGSWISWATLVCIYTYQHIRCDNIPTLACSMTCYIFSMNSRWCAGWSRSGVVIDYFNTLGCSVASFNNSPHRRQLFYQQRTFLWPRLFLNNLNCTQPRHPATSTSISLMYTAAEGDLLSEEYEQ